jgi:glycosyltransferase 2 family protein
MSQQKSNGSRTKRNLLILIGSLLGLFFLYISFKDISWKDLREGISQMELIYLLPCALLLMLIQFVRAFRFGIILSPFCQIGIKDLWDILNIWAGASMIMPARLGEFVRPYLVRQRGGSFSSAIGAVIVERFFDLSGLLLLLAVVLWRTPQVPPFYSFLGKILLAALLVGYLMVLLVLAKRDKVHAIVDRLLSWLPQRISSFVGAIVRRLIDGFDIMASFRQAAIIFLCTLAIWMLFSTTTYLFLIAFSIKAPFLVAVTIQVFLCFGVALPSAPGFIGTFHAAGRYALTLFGIQAVTAVSFATAYHLFSLVACLLLGLASYATSHFRFDEAIFSVPVQQVPQSEPPAVGADAAHREPSP